MGAEVEPVAQHLVLEPQALHGQVLHAVAGKYALQVPWAQTSSVLQALPQPPQLSGSLLSCASL